MTIGNRLTFATACTIGAIVGLISSVVGTWKKYNIKPAANIKWAAIIPTTINSETLEFLRAGSKTNTKTEPDRKAAVITNNHWRIDICITQRIETGI